MEEKIEKDVALEYVENGNMQHPYTEDEKRKVVRKLDLHLLPFCFLLYTFSVLDRSNLGNARTIGLAKDIDISGNNNSWLRTIFYIACIVFQFSTLGWKLFKPHQWVTAVVVFWGLASTLQATVTSWGGLMACRFSLGCAETGFGPGIPLYFSFFYPREMLGLRFGIFLSGAALANVYGNLLAYGLGHAHSSISSWKFLFIIEGVPNVLLAVATYFFLPDSPTTAKFPNERGREVARQIATSQPDDYEHEGLQLGQVGEAF